MSGLIIDSEACIGCGRCVRACASGGIVVEGERPNRCARVTDGCILCGGCVDACPVNAISIERDEAAGAVDLDAYRDIWVFVQTDEHDTVTPVAYELMGKGRELADARGCRLVALIGMGPEGSLGDLEHLVCAGADEVLACRDERLRLGRHRSGRRATQPMRPRNRRLHPMRWVRRRLPCQRYLDRA